MAASDDPRAERDPASAGALRHVVLAGPTASGKTAAALAVAASRAVEIVSVDSALVYRGMDIGTAKPSRAEREQVPHHLIDIRDPREPYSAAAFVADASRLVAEINARGRLPLLVGGTMLYLRALAEGIDEMPAADAATRARIEAEAKLYGWPAMHAQLAQVDPATAARLAPNDSQRIQRALEVWQTSGRTMSSFHAEETEQAGAADVAGNPGIPGMAAKPRRTPRGLPPTLMISLEPTDRTWLHERIAARFDAMLRDGLVAEVQALRARGDLDADLPSMRCVGYRQTWEALDGRWPVAELRDRGVAATRQLAKRQITWLRSMPARVVVAAEAPDAIEQVLELALAVP
ncbi:delta(2)-isopentenylpyrophosphate tRNA-adenosine transferase [Burkholderiales bacterium 8X]|nr:delta(2)-isopentenylpyrophosphate tRNA-adenosine transferase [Burkholderiales bacterium 8X]